MRERVSEKAREREREREREQVRTSVVCSATSIGDLPYAWAIISRTYCKKAGSLCLGNGLGMVNGTMYGASEPINCSTQSW